MKEVITRNREIWRDYFSPRSVEKAKQFVHQIAKLDYVASVTLHNAWHRDMVVNTFGDTGPTSRELNEIVAIRDTISSFEELPVYVLSQKDRFKTLSLRFPREVLMYKDSKPKRNAVA